MASKQRIYLEEKLTFSCLKLEQDSSEYNKHNDSVYFDYCKQYQVQILHQYLEIPTIKRKGTLK